MLIEKDYIANEFMRDLRDLENTFKTYSKLQAFLKSTTNYSLYYKEKRDPKTNKVIRDKRPFYCRFYAERVKRLRSSFKELFEKNSINPKNLNEEYTLKISFEPISNDTLDPSYKISKILFVSNLCVPEREMTEGLQVFLDTSCLNSFLIGLCKLEA